MRYSIRQTENSITLLPGDTPHTIERTTLEVQSVPTELAAGIPLQLLARRTDIRQSEQALVQAYYAMAEARAALYPVADAERVGRLDLYHALGGGQ